METHHLPLQNENQAGQTQRFLRNKSIVKINIKEILREKISDIYSLL